MSRGPSCQSANYTGQFFSPEFGVIVNQIELRPSDKVPIAWYGGKESLDGAQQETSLFLALRGQRMPIIDPGFFVFQRTVTPATNWSYIDPNCGDTKVSYNWTVPAWEVLSKSFEFSSQSNLFNFEVVRKASLQHPSSNLTSPSFQISPFAATTSSSTTTSSATQTSSSTTQTSSSSSTAAPSSSDGLSTGAKAGIGAGIGVFVLFILAIVCFVIFKRRARAKAAGENTGYTKAELSGEGAAPKPVAEISGANVYEKDAGANIHEKDSKPVKQPPVELPTN